MIENIFKKIKIIEWLKNKEIKDKTLKNKSFKQSV